ncbi:YbaB/EbfC family nucleoid-associated protein [Nocardia abscessus]|uniref:YbaB/EbfC family nucleoid-associated protein n=1 Tax=Nocardia abscessus TaxID=120957 RepID=UPI002457531A|nr:YbaB/EbfC family nucleoid-associated protein [Nocardia abscessus]
MAADFERRAGRFQELEGRMRELTVTESSMDRRVVVTVDSSGVPTAITLSPSSRGMDPAVLSAEIMSCLRQAHSTLRAEVTGLVRNTVGEDPAGVAITEQYAERFPDPDPPTVEPSEQRTSPPSGDNPSMAAPYFPPPGPASSYTAAPRSRKPDRDQIVVPDEPDPETEYYNRSWLV